jgi:hypothetical protein
MQMKTNPLKNMLMEYSMFNVRRTLKVAVMGGTSNSCQISIVKLAECTTI